MENIKEPDVTADEKIVSMIDTWQLLMQTASLDQARILQCGLFSPTMD